MMARIPIRRLVVPGLLIAVFGCLMYFPALGVRDIWAPEEGYYALEAKEMLERGDWIVPHVNGAPRLQKPALYHWLVLLSGKVTETTTRIPSALPAVLTALLTLIFATRWFGPRTGILSAIILSTTTLFLWHARYAGTDMLLTFFVAASCFCLREALCKDAGTTGLRSGLRPAPAESEPAITPNQQTVFFTLGFALAGLAVLSKGPVGALLPGLAVLVSLFWKSSAKAPPRNAYVYGIVALLAISIPWYALAINRTGQAYELIFRQNFLRFLSPWDHEGRSWYFYLFRLPLDLLPWSLFIPAIFAFFIRREKPDPQERFLIGWLAVVTLFFLVSGSRQGKYFLPMYPAFAILAARSLDGLLHAGSENKLSWWTRGGLVAFAVLAFLFAVLYPAGVNAAFKRYPEGAAAVAGGAKWFMVPIFLFGACIALCALCSWGRAGITALAAFMVVTYFATLTALMPALDTFKSPRKLAEAISMKSGPETKLAVLGKLQPGVSFYSGKRFELLPVDGGEGGRKSAARCRVFLAEPGERMVLMPEKHLELIRDKKGLLPPGVKIVFRRRLGSRILVLLSKGMENGKPR